MVTSQPVCSVNLSHILQRSTDRLDSECDHLLTACTSKRLFLFFFIFFKLLSNILCIFIEEDDGNGTADLTLVAGEAQADVLA